MIYTVEQFHGWRFVEVAATYSYAYAQLEHYSRQLQAPELPCRIIEKPEPKSAIWRDWQIELQTRKLWLTAIKHQRERIEILKAEIHRQEGRQHT